MGRKWWSVLIEQCCICSQPSKDAYCDLMIGLFPVSSRQAYRTGRSIRSTGSIRHHLSQRCAEGDETAESIDEVYRQGPVASKAYPVTWKFMGYVLIRGESTAASEDWIKLRKSYRYVLPQPYWRQTSAGRLYRYAVINSYWGAGFRWRVEETTATNIGRSMW